MGRSLPLLAFAFAMGCALDREAPSPIVLKAQKCGSGALAGASLAAMQEWFFQHRNCAVEVDAACKPIRESATAQWSESTEGKVCRAARGAAQAIPAGPGDHKTFQSGWK